MNGAFFPFLRSRMGFMIPAAMENAGSCWSQTLITTTLFEHAFEHALYLPGSSDFA